MIYLFGSEWLVRSRIDDAIDSIPVHMFGGAWSMIATGLFASPGKLEMVVGPKDHVGLFYFFVGHGDAKILAANFIGMFFIGELFLGTAQAWMVPR